MEVQLHIVDNHNKVFFYWQEAGIKDATLLHIDAHHDIVSLESNPGELSKDTFKSLKIDNFICAAAHYGIISRVYWLNPHSSKRRLQSFPKLRIYKPEAMSQDDNIVTSDNGEVIQSTELKISRPFILDIDLDAFCCNKNVNAVSEEYDGIDDWKQRVNQTTELLSKLPKPDIITISRSADYIPKDKVDEVQEYLVEKLNL